MPAADGEHAEPGGRRAEEAEADDVDVPGREHADRRAGEARVGAGRRAARQNSRASTELDERGTPRHEQQHAEEAGAARAPDRPPDEQPDGSTTAAANCQAEEGPTKRT